MSSVSDIKLIRTDFLYFENLLQKQTMYNIYTYDSTRLKKTNTKEQLLDNNTYSNTNQSLSRELLRLSRA